MRSPVQETKYLANRSSRQTNVKRGEGNTNRNSKENSPDWMVQTCAQQNEWKRSTSSHIIVKFQHIKDKDKILSFSENPTHIEMFINENGLIFLSSNIGTWEEPGTKLSPLSFSFFFFFGHWILHFWKHWSRIASQCCIVSAAWQSESISYMCTYIPSP